MGNDAIRNGGRITWAQLALAALGLLFVLVGFIWTSHLAEFREFRADTKASFEKLEALWKKH